MTAVSTSPRMNRRDASIIAAINKHQATDKGFGLALGPEAAGYAIAVFERLGYAVTHGADRIGDGARTIATFSWRFLPAGRVPHARSARCRSPTPLMADAPARPGRRREVVPPRRSCRSFCAPDRQALSRQDRSRTISHRQFDACASAPAWPVGAFDRRQRDARAARAENDRRDDHVQSVKAARRKKARHCVGATFDQYPAHAAQPSAARMAAGERCPSAVGSRTTRRPGPEQQLLPSAVTSNATDTVVTEDPALCCRAGRSDR